MLRLFYIKIRAKINKYLRNPLISNMLLVGGISLLVKVISFFKETIVASYFGLSELIDTYYIAVLIPTFIQNVFIGALKNLFIPNYVIELSTSNNKGSFQSVTFLAINVLTISLSLVAFVFVQFFLELVFPGHGPEYYMLVKKQFYIVLPCLFFWAYSGFLSGLLEIKNKFLISTVSQFILPIITIVCLVFLKPVFGDMVLAAGLTLGSLISLLYLIASSIKQNVLVFGSLHINSNIRIMLQQYSPKVTSGLLTGINPFVDQFFAAQLVVGSISAIQYGTKIPAFAIGILILAIGNVILPHFSTLINNNLEKAFKQLFSILKTIFWGSLVVTLIAIVLSDDIIRLLFERNEFTEKDTYIVSNIQRIALLYVPFYLCTLVCVRFLTALNKNRFMAWTSLWNMILNLILNIILIKSLAVYGLVLSTSIVYILASFIYVGFTYNLYKKYLNQKSK